MSSCENRSVRAFMRSDMCVNMIHALHDGCVVELHAYAWQAQRVFTRYFEQHPEKKKHMVRNLSRQITPPSVMRALNILFG